MLGPEVAMLTEFHSPPTEPESRDHHLAQAELGAEDREEAHRQDTEEVEEEHHQDGIRESQKKD